MREKNRERGIRMPERSLCALYQKSETNLPSGGVPPIVCVLKESFVLGDK